MDNLIVELFGNFLGYEDGKMTVDFGDYSILFPVKLLVDEKTLCYGQRVAYRVFENTLGEKREKIFKYDDSDAIKNNKDLFELWDSIPLENGG